MKISVSKDIRNGWEKGGKCVDRIYQSFFILYSLFYWIKEAYDSRFKIGRVVQEVHRWENNIEKKSVVKVVYDDGAAPRRSVFNKSNKWFTYENYKLIILYTEKGGAFICDNQCCSCRRKPRRCIKVHTKTSAIRRLHCSPLLLPLHTCETQKSFKKIWNVATREIQHTTWRRSMIYERTVVVGGLLSR